MFELFGGDDLSALVEDDSPSGGRALIDRHDVIPSGAHAGKCRTR